MWIFDIEKISIISYTMACDKDNTFERIVFPQSSPSGTKPLSGSGFVSLWGRFFVYCPRVLRCGAATFFIEQKGSSALRSGFLFVPAKRNQKLARGMPPGIPRYVPLRCFAHQPALHTDLAHIPLLPRCAAKRAPSLRPDSACSLGRMPRLKHRTADPQGTPRGAA